MTLCHNVVYLDMNNTEISQFSYVSSPDRKERVKALRDVVSKLDEDKALLVTRGEVSQIQEDWATESDAVNYKFHDLGLLITGFE